MQYPLASWPVGWRGERLYNVRKGSSVAASMFVLVRPPLLAVKGSLLRNSAYPSWSSPSPVRILENSRMAVPYSSGVETWGLLAQDENRDGR